MELLFRIFDYVGVFVFALSGSIMAVRKEMDLYGSGILAIMTALGGGLMRDIMIGRIPPLVLTDGTYVLTALAGVLTVYLLYENMERFHYPLRILDAVGLGVFTVLGSRMAMEAGLPWFAAVMIGVISGTGGGMIRDVLAREVPLVLQREIYAMAAVPGAMFYVAVITWTDPGGAASLVLPVATALFIAVFRILSVYRDWHMPRAFFRH